MVNDEKIKKAGDDKEVSIGRKIAAGVVLVFLVLMVLSGIGAIMIIVEKGGIGISDLATGFVLLIFIWGLYDVFCILLKR